MFSKLFGEIWAQHEHDGTEDDKMFLLKSDVDWNRKQKKSGCKKKEGKVNDQKTKNKKKLDWLTASKQSWYPYT